MGTVAGLLTRSYHGLLVAALKPPLGRTLLLANLEETVTSQNGTVQLFTNRWHPDKVQPEGYTHIDRFELDGTMPVWTFACGDVRLEKRIWMQAGANTTYVRYTLLEGEPVTLDIKALTNYRDHHARSRDSNVRLQVEPVEHGLKISAPSKNSVPFYILSQTANAEPQNVWHENLYLSIEVERGLEAYDNDLLAGVFHAELYAGESLDIIASTDADASLDGESATQARRQYEQELIAKSPLGEAPAEIRQLALAADQFIVRRGQGSSVIAGYPWFSDWGRDTMISLPGLTLETGRPEIAAQILRTFAEFVDNGMLPNRFPDAGEQPEYNTVDATLWYFQAIRAYHEHTHDDKLLRELFPVLEAIIDCHLTGTRHHIHVDSADQLLYAGEQGTQLTWMDAKYDDHVVTPRIGKPVEVNALWYNALCTMADFAHVLGRDSGQYEKRAEQVRRSFDRFWNDSAGYCYDVLDGPDGSEALLRPNQLFAVSLPYSPFEKARQRAIVEACESALLTPFGLRSLAPEADSYIGHYEGSTPQRDSAYHQGTVWSWLIGPFVQAHLRVHDDPQQARRLLEPLLKQHLRDYGLGSVSEIFDGNAPFSARGCPWQAWGVAELLRTWQLTEPLADG
jgi:predicted glycogen debranching enzyme